MWSAYKLMDEIKVGAIVTIHFDELQSNHYRILQREFGGQWVFEGYYPCTVNCDVSYCKGKMKFSNGLKQVFRCVFHNVAGKYIVPISIHPNFLLENDLFEI